MIEAVDELREIINYVKIFESTKECHDEVRRTADGKIFLIANLTQGLSLLTTAHDHPQLDCVYLYDSSGNTDRQEKQYSKVVLDRFAHWSIYAYSLFSTRFEASTIRSQWPNDI